MKFLLLYLAFCLISNISDAQLLKKLGAELKDDARWKVRMKANQKMDQGLDSLLSQPKKIKQKRKSKNARNGDQTPDEQNQVSQQNAAINTSSKDNDSQDQGQGFVSVELSAENVFTNDYVFIRGKSLKYGTLSTVTVKIAGPSGSKIQTAELKTDNSFSTTFQPQVQGNYSITATTSDKKASATVKLKVTDAKLGDWTEGNREETEKSLELLNKQVEKLKKELASKDKTELEKKMEDVKKDVDDLMEFFNSLSTARKELANKQIPDPLKQKLAQLSEALNEQREQMHEAREAADHEPYDNTVCEYMTMAHEACLAFKALTSWAKIPTEILKEIVKDNTPLRNESEKQSEAKEFIPAGVTAGKLFAFSKLNSEKITVKNVTKDVMGLTSDYLLKKYCSLFTGTVNHDYENINRNNLGTVWWQYKYITSSAITLRYPKNSSGKVVHMKGNIEGNATSFAFFQDVEQQEDFKQQMKGRVKLIPIEIMRPHAIPVSSTKIEGAGAVARGMFTPAYFNIPVDGEYDRDAGTITLFVHQALIDFGKLVKYKYGFIGIAAGIPLVTTFDFIVNKAQVTLNAVISMNNTLKVSEDANGNILVTGKGNREIGNEKSTTQHKINFSLSAKSSK